ncbi:A/G-specific adenine glycosylase [Aurantibacter crassamenti]|uniref:A/G-specific adenine glycosylase n=1 Tax=Aurantibacter crassamenti TaxID=1837375 RepID=UPI00193963FC|nr:A/G-specific adenine glycosylase [Aurantibacter crassamenti]MBM1104851.1 A/G-specific adenine glycosylase [Aurantibacter crassamenti]
MSFSQKVLHWYALNMRHLPWRATQNPYRIWLSEIMLQQTRVAQGTPYYLKFVEKYPTVIDLAEASEDEVLKLWQGLGYYSRARNLHATAKKVAFELNGQFPNTYKGLLKLKGVGDYTASAIASICFNEPKAVVDGNVYRVLARYFGIDTPINSTEGIKYFKELATEVMNTDNIRDYNQGIMEFGSLQCAPKNPDCTVCPLNESCVALEKNMVDKLPVKINKTKIRKRYFNYLVILNEKNEICLQQRTGKGIWQNLWEFPLIESLEKIEIDAIRNQINKLKINNSISELYLHNEIEIVHKLSHQHLYTRFWMVKTNGELENSIPLTKIEDYPVPVLLAEFIKELQSSIVS